MVRSLTSWRVWTLVAALGCGTEAPSNSNAASGMLSPGAAPAAAPSGSPRSDDAVAPGTAPAPTAPTTSTEAPPQPAQRAPNPPLPAANAPGASAPIAAPTAPAATATTPPAANPPTPSSETCNLPGAVGASTPSIWVIGDSTASVYAANLYPRMGWAQPLQDSFAPACASIQDRAISGRSSKSFFDEGAWAPVRDALKSGDFVLIQFGHNDEKSDDPLRFTEPFSTFQQYLSTYLDDTLARGATPILLTPINRNKWNGAELDDTHGEYPAAMRALAQTRQVALVDTTALTKTYFERIGEAATTALFMDLAVGQFPNYPDGNVDNTHLQEQGARNIAQLILADLALQSLPVAGLTKLVATPP